MPRLKKATRKIAGPKRAGRKVVAKRVAPQSGPKRAVAKADGLSKFQRFRRAQARKGMKLLRIWVPDPKSPDFAAEAERQAKLLRGRPEEEEAIRFAEAAFADFDKDEPDFDWSKS
jgi:hypothetical protein